MNARLRLPRVVLAGVSVAAVVLITAGAEPPPPPEQPSIAWHGCRTGPGDEVGEQLEAAGARCGELTVPLDYARPGGRTISVAVARRAATDPAHRLGTLMVDTGGPGPSRSAVSWLAQGSPAVAARYDLVGIDPRFFGLSTPMTCGWPAGLALRNSQIGTPDRAAFDRSVVIAKDLASRCADHRDLLPYASTRDVARDMDRVRAALGEPEISYLGVSSATYLGAVYLQMFPGHTAQTVLDSALAPDAYGPALTRETAPANAASLVDWASWAALRNARYGLGDTSAGVMASVDQIIAAANRRPLRVGSHRVDKDMIPGLLLTPPVETDTAYANFSDQVRVLRDAAQGVPAAPTADLEKLLTLYDSPDVIADYDASATNANQCADRAASRDPGSYFRDIQAHQATEPLFGPLFRKIGACAFWPTAPVEAPTRIGNHRPALILSATGDPVAPYAGQQALHRALTGSRMVTLADAFRHGVYLSEPNTCVDTAVERYLLDDVLPGTDLTCAKPASTR